MRSDAAKTEVNSRTKSRVRTFEKKLRKALEEGDKENAPALLLKFVSTMDRAAQKGVFHKNTADRKKSRLSAQVHKLTV